jgi:hypothetical protein
MMQMMVDNLDTWREHIEALDLSKVSGFDLQRHRICSLGHCA